MNALRGHLLGGERADDLRHRLSGMWDSVRAWLYGLRIAWVSTASVVAGFLLFLTPQAQDLFLEVRGELLLGVWFWTRFYLFVLLVWVLPVYVAARWILWQCRTGCSVHQDARPVADSVRRRLPPMLACGIMLALAFGQFLTLVNVPDLVDLSTVEEQLDRLKGEAQKACAVPIGLHSVNGACGLAAARLLGSGAQWIMHTEWKLGSEWMILAMYGFGLWLIFWRLLHRLAGAWLSGVARFFALTAWWTLSVITLPVGIVIGVVFFGALWQEAQQSNTLVHLAALPGVSLLLAYALWLALKQRPGESGNWLAQFIVRRAGGVANEAEAVAAGLVVWLQRVLVALALLATVLLLVLDPIAVSRWIYRIAMVPFILGPLVPLMTWLSFQSVRLQAPLVATLLVGIGLFSSLAGDKNAVRTAPMTAGTARETLAVAAERWAKANGCTLDRAIECPSPIIVSAAGGASRAGFLTAGLIGKLIDERTAAGSAAASSGPLRPIESQLFAISGVSGGALGAVMTVAAMADKGERRPDGSHAPPCTLAGARADTQWYAGAQPAHQSWRSCLGLLLAGDFLSPVFVRLLGSDLIGIGLGGDRAAVLEESWEQRYREITGRGTLAETLTTVRKRTADKGEWLPLLLLNGTSVESGRRIVTSDVDLVRATRAAGAPTQRLLVDADDLHDLLGRRGAPASTAASPVPAAGARDIRLSTAATMSARFPVISPHGSIIGVDGRVVDRVVDGGYYENFGATTALELARELVVRWGLVSTIVVVNNEPTEHRLGCGVEADPAAAAGTTPQSRLFSMVTAPLGAVINTRTARGSYAAVELCRYIRSETALRGEFTFITVRPSGAKPLSMSWWLSKYVQQYLDLHLAVPPGGTEPTMRDRAFTGVNQDALQLIEERRRMR